ESFDVTRDHVIVHTLEQASSRLAIWSHSGQRERGIELGGLTSVTGPAADPAGHRFGYTVQSFAEPPVAAVADARDGTSGVTARLDLPSSFDARSIAVDQETYRSK